MNIIIPLFVILGILLLILIFILAILLRDFLTFIFWGAIYVPSKKEKVKKMIKLAKIKSGEKAVDLGSGDGRLVIALAEAGAEAHGYEINPMLIYKSRRNIRKAGLENNIFIHWKNFWKADLSKFDIIFVYGMKHVMKKLEKKLGKEFKKNARVVSNIFEFPNLPKTKEENSVYLYKK